MQFVIAFTSKLLWIFIIIEKMYHETNPLNAHSSNSSTKQNRAESRSRRKRLGKDGNSHHKKPHPKPLLKKSKWEAKLKNSHVKNYDSDYLGPNRLTKHMGFLAKGKISDSISRLEELVPPNLRARTKQDLHRILELNNGKRTKNQISDSREQASQCHEKNVSSSEEESDSGPINDAIFASPVKHFVNDAWKSKLGELSARLTGKKSVFSSDGKSSTEPTPQQSSDEVSICREIITGKLHPAIRAANNSMFPNVFHQTKLLDELLDIKTQYEAGRKIVSSSSNCESSQDTTHHVSHVGGIEETNFRLKPVLTQEDSAVKQLENMFPVPQNYSSESEDDVYVDVQTLLNKPPGLERSMLEELDSKPEYSSTGKNSSVVIISSSVSSDGSPVMAHKVSPVKFVPEFPPTPKLYFRQKMF